MDISAQAEKSVLGSVMLSQEKYWGEASALRPDDFGLETHRKIFAAMQALTDAGSAIEVLTLTRELGKRGAIDSADIAYISDLPTGIPHRPNIQQYVALVRESAGKRWAEAQGLVLSEQSRNGSGLADLIDFSTRIAKHLGEYQNSAGDWRSIFHSYQEFEAAAPLQFAINGFLQEAGVTLIGGLSGHGKTLIMLAMTHALLNQAPLFNWDLFSVPRASERVLYLIPESAIGPFWSRIKTFRLEEHLREGRLLVRTLSSAKNIPLTDPRILEAAKGADIFLDTAVRFMEGAENDVENAKVFASNLFALLSAGARTITGAHHAPKGFGTSDRMTLENILRGSGDIGAMLCTAWGVRQIDSSSNRIYVQNVKPRDFQPCPPFVIEGRPHLDNTGNFLMLEPPGSALDMAEYVGRKGGAPSTPGKEDKMRQAVAMRESGKSLRDIAAAVGVSKSGVEKWLREYDQDAVH